MRTTLGLSLFFYSALSLAAFPGKLDAFSVLLVSYNTAEVKLAGQSIAEQGIKDPALLDLVAERFCIYADRDGDMDKDAPDNSETVSWLAGALGQSGDGKYRPMLEKALQKTQSKKNRKYFTKALAQLPAASASPYTPKCGSLEELRSQVLSSRAPAAVDAAKLSGIKEGQGLDTVYQQAGLPTEVRRFGYRIHRPFVGGIDEDGIELQYGGAGHIQFEGDDNWQVSGVFVNVVDPAADPNSPDKALMDKVLSGDPDTYSQAAQDMIDNRQFPQDVLDAAARRVWKQRDASDGDAVDGLAWLCKLLGSSGNMRYRTVLSAVADKAAEKKLRKYAKESLEMLPAGDVEQLPLPEG